MAKENAPNKQDRSVCLDKQKGRRFSARFFFFFLFKITSTSAFQGLHWFFVSCPHLSTLFTFYGVLWASLFKRAMSGAHIACYKWPTCARVRRKSAFLKLLKFRAENFRNANISTQDRRSINEARCGWDFSAPLFSGPSLYLAVRIQSTRKMHPGSTPPYSPSANRSWGSATACRCENETQVHQWHLFNVLYFHVACIYAFDSRDRWWIKCLEGRYTGKV